MYFVLVSFFRSADVPDGFYPRPFGIKGETAQLVDAVSTGEGGSGQILFARSSGNTRQSSLRMSLPGDWGEREIVLEVIKGCACGRGGGVGG